MSDVQTYETSAEYLGKLIEDNIAKAMHNEIPAGALCETLKELRERIVDLERTNIELIKQLSAAGIITNIDIVSE